MYTLIQTAKLNDVDPQAWLADVLARIADIPQNRLSEFCSPGTGAGSPWTPLPRSSGLHRRLASLAR
jgi:IS66 C-terminal element